MNCQCLMAQCQKHPAKLFFTESALRKMCTTKSKSRQLLQIIPMFDAFVIVQEIKKIKT